MVHPKYSPEEALQRVKLMMKYDSSKTLNENKETISEQLATPAVAGAATGAALGAGAAATGLVSGTLTGGGMAGLATSVGLATGVMGTAAATTGLAIVGGAIGLGLLPLVYWFVTKDTGANKVKKMFEMCSSDSAKIAKLPRKLQDADFRSISDDIEDAIVNDSYGFQGGTDEEKLFGAFKKLEAGTASDFCGLVKYYNSHSDSGDLFDDLDGDIDAESEWKQIYRPIRNCVEDSLLTIKDESPVKGDGKKTGIVTGGGKTGGGSQKSKYSPCSPGKYVMNCKSDVVKQVQACLGMPSKYQTGNFGPITKGQLQSKFPNLANGFTDSDVAKICNKQVVNKPVVDNDIEDVDAQDASTI